jgi:multiple sugar transport system ATP-binding protein
MVFQSYALFPHMTVAENLALPLRMRRMQAWQRLPWLGRWLPGTRAIAAQIESEVRSVAQSVDLAHLLERKPRQLSGGQRQRVAVARAMVRHPSVFLMDEPLSNLDANMRAQLRTEIAELHRRLGVTFLYVTHDQVEAMTMSSRIAVMLNGRIHQVGTPREVYENPATRMVATFLGEPRINLLKGIVRPDGAVECQDTTIPARLALASLSEITVGLRPESLTIGASGFSATVTRVEYLGAGAIVHSQLRNGDVVIARASAGVNVKVGDKIRLKPEGPALFFDEAGERVHESASVESMRVCS